MKTKGDQMVVKFRKKVRRQRGRRWHGWGSKKKHRGGGSRGGRGMAGSKKHKRSYVYAKMPDYFGKRGFASRKPEAKAINIDLLDAISEKAGSAEINLEKLGFSKLLGRGNAGKPYMITVKAASKSAIEKIEAAGGKVNTAVPANDEDRYSTA